MPVRHNRLFSLINRATNGNPGPWGIQIGHPCGFIATSRHLRHRPSLSKRVSDFLVNDASMSGDFEDMLMQMRVHRCALSKRAKLRVKQWIKAGCPTWKNHAGLSEELHMLYTCMLHKPADEITNQANAAWADSLDYEPTHPF